MDSKANPPSSSHDDETNTLPPPSYIESQSSNTHNIPHFSSTSKEKQPSSDPTPTYYSTDIQTQLSSLLTNISIVKSQRTFAETFRDVKILTLLSQEIARFLTSFATTGLHKGTLILIPAAGMKDETALPIDYIFSNDSREYTHYARIVDDEAQKKIDEHKREKEKFGYDYEAEEDEKEDLWFWNDEVMARRLAEQLRPVVKAEKRELPPRVVVEKSQATSSAGKTSFWSRGKSKEKQKEVVIPDVKPVVREKDEDRVVMDVQAEEVSFRLENDCGLYESKVGFGIVIRLTVILAE